MEDEPRPTETNSNPLEATSKSDGSDEKPDINDVPMDENQVSTCIISRLLLLLFIGLESIC